MRITKFSLLGVALLSAGVASAGTYTWTGVAGDNQWFTAGNWLLDGEAATASPGNAPSDDVVINGAFAVEYNPGGDWMPTGSTTISGGATLTQVVGNAYPQPYAPLIIDGGTYDTGSAGTFRVNGTTVTVKNNGLFTLKTAIERLNEGGIVLEAGGRMTASANYVASANDSYKGGTLTVAGEFQPGAEMTVDGTVITCTIYAPQAANRSVTFTAGGLICTSSGLDGFWLPADTSYINISSDSTATFTMPVDADSIHAKYFATGKFRIAGETVSADDFEDVINVTDNGDGTTTFKLGQATPVYQLGAVTVDNLTIDSVEASVVVTKLGEEGGKLYVAHATSEAEIDFANASYVADLTEAGATLTATVEGLTADTRNYIRFAVKEDDEFTVASDVVSVYPTDKAPTFIGSDDDHSWSTASNWAAGEVPTEGEVIIEGDCTYDGNLDLSKYQLTINDAAFTVSQEIQHITSETTVNGGTLKTVTYVNGGDPMVVKGGAIISTRASNYNVRGMWEVGAFFNFLTGKACSYTYNYEYEKTVTDEDGNTTTEAVAAPTFEDEFNYVFGGGHILVDGEKLTDTNRVAFALDEVNHTVTLTLKAVAAAFESASTATKSGVNVTLSATVSLSDDRPLYVLTGTSADDLTATLISDKAVDGQTYTHGVTGAEGEYVYWQFRLGDGENAVYDSKDVQRIYLSSGSNVWVGGTSAKASDASNWQNGAVPDADTAVIFNAETATSTTLEWDLENVTVASWTQNGGVVYFETTADSKLTVAGDVTLTNNVTWTHTGPSENPTTMVNVEVQGNLMIDEGSMIQAGTSGQGEINRARGYQQGSGPGFNRAAGGSFAGEGGHIAVTIDADTNERTETALAVEDLVTYGSILDPLSYGSAGWGDGIAFAGGGIVKLAVAGTLTVNGAITSRGFGWALDAQATLGGAGSGGSVNITAGSLAGSGKIDANGGGNGLYGAGAGGRVKVALTDANATFDAFSGTIEANGGFVANEAQITAQQVSAPSGGTVTLIAGETTTVKVNNELRYGTADSHDAYTWITYDDSFMSAVSLPAKQDGDKVSAFSKTDWIVSANGAVRLTANVTLNSLTINAAEDFASIIPNGYTLTVRKLIVDGQSLGSGVYTTANLPGVISGEGSIKVNRGAGSFVLVIR